MGVCHSELACAQAHADALGTWGGGVRAPDGQMARRAWEGDGRIDLRSVTNSLRQLPYHVAWQRGFRQAATVLNPTIAIDIALETARDLDDGATFLLHVNICLASATGSCACKSGTRTVSCLPASGCSSNIIDSVTSIGHLCLRAQSAYQSDVRCEY